MKRFFQKLTVFILIAALSLSVYPQNVFSLTAFSYSFESGQTDGWSGSAILQENVGSCTLQTDTAKAYEGKQSLRIEYSGSTKYVITGPEPETINPGDRIEYWIFIPKSSNLNRIYFYSIDSEGNRDESWFHNDEGLVRGKWFNLSYRVDPEGNAPFSSYGFDLETEHGQSGSLWIDAIRIKSDEVKTCPTVPGLRKGVSYTTSLSTLKEGNNTLNQSNLDLIRNSGFDHIRLPIKLNDQSLETAPYTINEDYLELVDLAIAQALAKDLNVILDLHNYPILTEGTNKKLDEERYFAFWTQLSNRYSQYSDNLYFQILDEPDWYIGSEKLNSILQKSLSIIRETNPTRNLIVPHTRWSGVRSVNMLELPENDRHLIVSIHFYEPIAFTHQGTDWIFDSLKSQKGVPWSGTVKEKYAISDLFDLVADWAVTNNRPVILDEFGVYNLAPSDDRAIWTDFVRETAEERNISWTYWEFNAGFGVFAPWKGMFRLEVLDALIPDSIDKTGTGFTIASEITN
ncbi:glycoside hydrolase family 5 [Syntrophobotulus glycolicus DSM 8271]|uniref:Glycoside hydrolase family 5 n=1 Tax=Syntrophobotulus glycolicus (strain DSM 8271 / FlGlyR) TaxID=645991 RepID=F0SY74_SYNGF|nr:glycoside hydrolase family 5 protein [Syntrophobotulus glycolicus]ADY55909.1 glycoside hydrolase family 5 [Syntrophobotulus glycolicus DSM 8271]